MSESRCWKCAKAKSMGYFCGYEGTECSEYPGMDFICPEHPFWNDGCDKFVPKEGGEKITSLKPVDEPLTDLDVVFFAIYNLIYEKIENDTNKGIVVSRGNPNQRKVSWKKVMSIAHMLEDFFALRKQRTGCRTCEECKHWKSVSIASPHLGKCTRYNKDSIHKFNSCKKGFEPKG